MRKRMRAKLAEIKEEMRYRLHHRIAEQGKWRKSVVADYFACHAVPTNARCISAFRYHVIQMWLKPLRRRSQQHNMPRERMNRIINAWIPPAVIRHPWPINASTSNIQGRSGVRQQRMLGSARGARREPRPCRDWVFHRGALMCLAKPRAAAEAGTWRPGPPPSP